MRPSAKVGGPLVALACMLASWAYAEAAPVAIRQMTVRPDLFERTVPAYRSRLSWQRPPGSLLYPGYGDLEGMVTVGGPEAFATDALEQARAAQNDPEALARLFWVIVKRSNPGGKPPIVQWPVEGMTIELPGEGGLVKTENVVPFRFRIPIELGPVWTEGEYVLRMGWRYTEDGARKSIGSNPVYFEVKQLEAGTEDEVNLITNTWMLGDGPPGLADRLLRRKEYKGYTRPRLIERLLEIDPHDAWASHEAAKWALSQQLEPERAVRLYEELLRIFREGRAHRSLEMLELHMHLRPSLPRNLEEVEKRIEERLQYARRTVQYVDAARDQVAKLAAAKDHDALIGLIVTEKDSDLWHKPGRYEPVLAIRQLGQMRVREAHVSLVRELSKLQRTPSLFQRELVNALARIHGNTKRVEFGPMDEDIAVITWWLDHPNPSDVPKAMKPGE